MNLFFSSLDSFLVAKNLVLNLLHWS